jgi:Tfp pilus assembly protein PilX
LIAPYLGRRLNRDGQQAGAITLLMVMLLVLLASMVGLFTARSIGAERAGSNNLVWSVQTQNTAEAALDSASAELASIFSTTPNTFWSSHDPAQCLPSYSGLEWQCRSLALDNASNPQGHTVQIRVMRDLVRAPHVALVHVQAQHPGNHTGTQVQQSLYLPTAGPIGTGNKATALLTQGCVNEAISGSTRFCASGGAVGSCIGSNTQWGTAIQSLFAPDVNGDGIISLAEQQACVQVNTSSLQGGAVVTPTSAVPAPNPSACDMAVWTSLFGQTTPAQIQAISQAQELKGLSHLTQPTRTVYWIDSPSEWTQSLGSATAPVLLVFSATACASQCPRIGPDTKITGTVFLDTQCQDLRAAHWQSGAVTGQVAVTSGLPNLQAGSQFLWLANHRQAFDWPWPDQIDARQVQRVRGSWKSGG